MALIKELKGSFVGGKVSKPLQNRIDLEKFNTWLSEAKNTQIKPEGSISNRAGTIFIGIGKDATYRLTINVNVSATIIINGQTFSGTSASLDIPVDNPNYTYSVGASGYTTQEDSGPLTGNKVISVTLEASVEQYTFTIVNSQGATIKINGTEQSTITANSGTTITWSVEKEGYLTQGDTFVLSESETKTITLVEISEVTLTINATPADSTIKINGEIVGAGTASKDIQINTAYTYEVSNSGYITQTGSGTITQNTTINITMQESYYDITGINTDEANHYIAHLKVQTLLTRTIQTAGTYKITLAGGVGYLKFTRTSDSSTTFTKFSNGGIIVCEKSFTVGQVLTFKKISGATLAPYTPTGDTLLAGGCGIALLVDDVVVLVAGGGAVYQTDSFQSGDKYSGYGGGGYVGGRGQSWQGGSTETYSGYSIDGTRGNSTSVTGSSGGKSAKGSGYGGSGYVATGYTATTQYNANNNNGYLKLEFV